MTAKLLPVRFQVPSDSFTNVPGALMYFYEAGTLTPVTVYATADLLTTLPNPVEADGYGLFPDIFLVPDDYDITVTDADDNLLWDAPDFTVQDIPVLDPDYFDLIDDEYVPAIGTNAQTGTSYTILNSDRAKIITLNNSSGGTVTLPSPSGSSFPAKWFCYISNIGTGGFTISSVANINGSSTYTLAAGSFTLLVSNGTTYSAGASSNQNQIYAMTGGTLTIATGAITIGGFSQYVVDTQGSASTDDLDTINGGAAGKILVLQPVNAARNIVIKNNTGNILNPEGDDITLKALSDSVTLRYNGTTSKWNVLAYSNAAIKLVTTSPAIADQAVVFGTAGSVAHGLGGVPKFVQLYLVNVTTDGEWIAGDVVQISAGGDNAPGGDNPGIAVWSDATNVNWRFSAEGFVYIKKTTGSIVDLTAANWNLRIIPYY